MKIPDKVKVASVLFLAGFAGGIFVANKTIHQVEKYTSTPPKPPNNDEQTISDGVGGKGRGGGAGMQREGDGGQRALTPSDQGGGEGRVKYIERDQQEGGDENKEVYAGNPLKLNASKAIFALVGNTIVTETPNKRPVYIYLSPRGLASRGEREMFTINTWREKGGFLCQPETFESVECRKVFVTLMIEDGQGFDANTAEKNFRKIFELPEGARIGRVSGFGLSDAYLYRGNLTHFPDFIPLLDDKPKKNETLVGAPPVSAHLRGVVGQPLATSFWVADRTNTLYLPDNRLLEVTRAPEATDILRAWLGKWSQKDDALCRDLQPDDAEIAARRDLSRLVSPAPIVECSSFEKTTKTVTFPEALDRYRQNYVYAPFPANAAKTAMAHLLEEIETLDGAGNPSSSPKNILAMKYRREGITSKEARMFREARLTGGKFELTTSTRSQKLGLEPVTIMSALSGRTQIEPLIAPLKPSITAFETSPVIRSEKQVFALENARGAGGFGDLAVGAGGLSSSVIKGAKFDSATPSGAGSFGQANASAMQPIKQLGNPTPRGAQGFSDLPTAPQTVIR